MLEHGVATSLLVIRHKKMATRVLLLLVVMMMMMTGDADAAALQKYPRCSSECLVDGIKPV